VFVVKKLDLKGTFVLKVFHNKQNKQMIEKEIKIGMMVAKECPFLVSYTEIFQESECFCIVMEYCEKGDLEEFFNKENSFDQNVCINFFLLYIM
jgi:serine/threonine protein kinase